MVIRIVRGLAFFAVVVLLTSRCANVMQGPGGGPKDSIPPALLLTVPEFYAVNQQPKRVVLQFNEYVQVKEASKNVIVSPPSIIRPEVRTRGKGVQVVFNDSLQRDATYTIDFGASISDLNESNPFPPFRYVFSTGPVIDSMKLTGKVLDAYTREFLPDMIVALYTNLSDTAISKTMPVAVSRTDEWGYFTIQNIPPADYAMVAFLDKNNNYRYDAGSEMLAFTDSLVRPITVISDSTDLLTTIDPKDTTTLLARPYEWEMYAFTENVGKQFLKEQVMPDKRQINLVFNRPHAVIDTFRIRGVDSSYLVEEHSRFRDTVTYWITAPELPDTTNVHISYLKTDSLDQLSSSSARLRLQVAKKEEPEKKKDGEEEEKQVLKPDIKYDIASIMKNGVNIRFPALLTQVDTSKIQLRRQDEKDKTVYVNEPFTLTKDTLKIREYHLQAKWQTGTGYELLLLPDAFRDVYGLATDTLKHPITTGDPDKFSSMKLEVSGISEGEQVLLQLLDEKKKSVLREEVLTADGNVQLDYLKAGKYTIRLIRDENENGIWDPGIYLERKQSEPAEFYALPDNKEVIELLENADLTQQVNVAAVFSRNRKDELPEIIHTHEHDDEHDHEE